MCTHIFISGHVDNDQRGVKELVLSVLGEFGFGHISEFDVDLEDPKKFYIDTGGVFYVLKDKDKVAGTVAVINHHNSRGEIKRIYLRKELRGKGYEANLLDKAIAFCRDKGFRTIELSTGKHFTKAHLIYKSKGFQIVREDGVSYYMAKEL